jgi:hypothetical protein
MRERGTERRERIVTFSTWQQYRGTRSRERARTTSNPRMALSNVIVGVCMNEGDGLMIHVCALVHMIDDARSSR